MFTSESLLQVFVVVVIINIAILEVAVFVLWRRGRAVAPSSTAGGARSATAASSSIGGPRDPSTNGLGGGPSMPNGQRNGPGQLLDPDTGLESAVAWHDALRHEDARAIRYGRPATVMVMELIGFEQLADRLGQDVADRLIIPIATTLVRNSRAADRIARIAHTRFHVLMPETDEISAINYVERVREATDMWLEAGAVAVRTAIGWASPPSGGSLADAVRLADERMRADRQAAPRPRTRVPQRSVSRTST